MSDPNFNTTEASTDFPLQDVEAIFDDLDDLDDMDEEQAQAGDVRGSGLARRSLEERQEAQRLRRLLSDYAWDDREI